MNLEKIIKVTLALAGVAMLTIGVSKIIHFESFVNALDGYMVFPEWSLELAAALFIGIEILLGLGLCIPRFQRKSALGLIGLLLIFTVAIGSSLLHGLSIDCGCFGALTGPTKISWFMVERNLGIALLLSFVLFRTSPKRNEWKLQKIRSFLVSRSLVLGSVLLVAAMAIFMVWLMQNDRILLLRLEMVDPSLKLKVGDMAPRLLVRPVGGGKEKEINFIGDHRTVLLIFSPTCPHCQEAIRWWNMRLQSLNLESNPPKVIGVSVNPEIKPEFLNNFQVSFPIYIPGNVRKFNRAYKVSLVPMTIFVNPNGKIAFAFQGFPPKSIGSE